MKKLTGSTANTSFHDVTIQTTKAKLKKIMPEWVDDIGDKSTFEACAETDDGRPFTIYDWKEPREPEEHQTITWHIGGHDKATCLKAKKEILNALDQA